MCAVAVDDASGARCAAVVLIAVALVAVWIPARRATRVNPATVLEEG